MLTQGGSKARPVRPFLDEADRFAELAGLGISQVSVVGQRMTSDSDIFAALDLEQTRSLVRFDSLAARSRIERLPWVTTATITRILPDGISVVVAERRPFAVWTRASGDNLIDDTGRVLGPIEAGHAADLPRVAGDGAALAAPMMLAEIQRYPGLADRVRLAQLVGERRWTLRLIDGTEVRLPAGPEGGALSELMQLDAESHILDSKFSVVDMRVPGRLVLRPRLPTRETPSPAAQTTQPSG